VLVKKLIVFGKGVNEEVAMMVFDLFEIGEKMAGIAVAEIAEAGAHGGLHNQNSVIKMKLAKQNKIY